LEGYFVGLAMLAENLINATLMADIIINRESLFLVHEIKINDLIGILNDFDELFFIFIPFNFLFFPIINFFFDIN
jgi:hypothetical protein